MSDQHPSDGDEFHIEVGDAPVRSPRTPANGSSRTGKPTGAPAVPFAPRLTSRARALRASGIAGAVLLALVVVLGGFPATRNGATRLLAGRYSTPTATVVPSSNAFYLLPNPPGTTVLLDGHALARLPLPGDPHPLLLTPGAHTFAWRNTRFPFQPLSCHIAVPRTGHDTCPLIEPYQVPTLAGGVPLAAPIIADRFTLAALPDAQVATLTTAIQAALASMTATANIQPGDHYLNATGGGVAVANQPLTAIFHVRPITDLSSMPCFNAAPWATCSYLGQTCEMLCTLPNPGNRGAGPASRWIVGAPVQLSWSYVAHDGTPIQRNIQAPGYGVETALLGVAWDGTSWQAQPLLGLHTALPASDDLVCDAVWQPFYASPQVSYLFYPNASYSVNVQYASGARVSDSCVVRMTNDTQTTAPLIPDDGTALFLERCGVLLAASDAAHTLWPELPQASPAERQDAQQLAAALPNQ